MMRSSSSESSNCSGVSSLGSSRTVMQASFSSTDAKGSMMEVETRLKEVWTMAIPAGSMAMLVKAGLKSRQSRP